LPAVAARRQAQTSAFVDFMEAMGCFNELTPCPGNI
jgi:hypothetical protein